MDVGQKAPPRGHRHGYHSVRESILQVAREIMRAEGVGGLTLNEVARRLGMRAPSLYTYFASKHDLYDALFLLGMREYRRRLAAAVAGNDSWGGRLAAVMADYMAFADENPELYALCFERPVPGFVPSQESMVEASGLLEDGRSLFEQALASRALESGMSAPATRDLALALMHGLTALRRANEPEAEPGTGRFAPLVPAAVALLMRAWTPQEDHP